MLKAYLRKAGQIRRLKHSCKELFFVLWTSEKRFGRSVCCLRFLAQCAALLQQLRRRGRASHNGSPLRIAKRQLPQIEGLKDTRTALQKLLEKKGLKDKASNTVAFSTPSSTGMLWIIRKKDQSRTIFIFFISSHHTVSHPCIHIVHISSSISSNSLASLLSTLRFYLFFIFSSYYYFWCYFFSSVLYYSLGSSLLFSSYSRHSRVLNTPTILHIFSILYTLSTSLSSLFVFSLLYIFAPLIRFVFLSILAILTYMLDYTHIFLYLYIYLFTYLFLIYYYMF